jgi:hypothetical protein
MLDSKASRMGTGVAAVTESASAQEAAEAVTAARIEDLEEALRRIVVVLQPDGRHQLCDRDLAAIAVACDVLDLDVPEVDWLAALGTR